MASWLLSRRARGRYLHEWWAEARAVPTAAGRAHFCLGVLAGAWQTGRALRSRAEHAVLQLGLAISFAVVGPLWFLGVALARLRPGPAIGFALFIAAMVLGGLDTWRGRTDLLGTRRTRLAGLVLASACVVFASLASKLPTTAELARHDNAAQLAVALGAVLVVVARSVPVDTIVLTRLGLFLTAVGAVGVAVVDLHNLLVVDDPVVRFGLVLTSGGSFVAAAFVAAAARWSGSPATTADSDTSEGPVHLIQ